MPTTTSSYIQSTTTSSSKSQNGIYISDGFNLEWLDDSNSTYFSIKTTSPKQKNGEILKNEWFAFGLSTDQKMVYKIKLFIYSYYNVITK